MSDRWQVVVTKTTKRLVPYGPAGDKLPAGFTAEIDYSDPPLRARLTASFDGVHRVKVESVVVERTDGESVTPEDMTSLQLAQVIHRAVWEARAPGPGTLSRTDLGPQRDERAAPTDEDLKLLARQYWFEFVAWGKPRQDVMWSFKLPRSTANRWIRKARELYGLPGPHADAEGSE